MTGGWVLALAGVLVVGGCLFVWVRAGGLGVVAGRRAGPVERVLLYDGSCGFCHRWLVWSQRRRQWPVRAMDCAQASQERARVGLTVAQCAESAFLLEFDAEGRARALAGAAAVNGVLAGFRGWRHVGWRFVASLYPLPLVRQVENLLYRWVARNRHRFGSGACEVRPTPSGPRLGPPR